MHKLIIRLNLLSLIIISFGCENTEDPVVDCTLSEFILQLESVTDAHCALRSGSVSVIAQNGTPPFMYSIDGIRFQAQSNFSLLPPGSYQVIAVDANNCTATLDVVIEGEGDFDVVVATSNADCQQANGRISLTPSGGSPGYHFKIGTNSFQDSGEFLGLEQGVYTITALDSEGCEITFQQRVLSDVSWAIDIRPIIDTRCALPGCHNGSSSLPNWTDFETVQENASKIRSATSTRAMPPGTEIPLTSEQISLISCWVNDGALNN